jgi:CDP-diacylglycerol pyrophosphatase
MLRLIALGGAAAALSLLLAGAPVHAQDAGDAGPDAKPKATQLCPDPNPVTKQADPGHYFATQTSGDKAPNQCNSCADPKNNATSSCAVYNVLRKCGITKTNRCEEKTSPFSKYNIYTGAYLRYALAQVTPQTTSCHFVVFALDPVIGVEDVLHRGVQNFWDHAFYASQKIISPPIDPQSLGLAINPATKRGQHQLHIHVGKLKSGYRTALEKLPRDNAFHSVKANGKTYSGIYMPDDAGPIPGLSPFELVAKRYGEKNMPLEGLIVARSKDGKGIYVLAGLNVTTELELDYSGTCTFPAP